MLNIQTHSHTHDTRTHTDTHEYVHFVTIVNYQLLNDCDCHKHKHISVFLVFRICWLYLHDNPPSTSRPSVGKTNRYLHNIRTNAFIRLHQK